jgi:hypothetical protein
LSPWPNGTRNNSPPGPAESFPEKTAGLPLPALPRLWHQGPTPSGGAAWPVGGSRRQMKRAHPNSLSDASAATRQIERACSFHFDFGHGDPPSLGKSAVNSMPIMGLFSFGAFRFDCLWRARHLHPHHGATATPRTSRALGRRMRPAAPHEIVRCAPGLPRGLTARSNTHSVVAAEVTRLQFPQRQKRI